MAFLNKGSADVIPRAEAPQTRNLPLPTLLGKPKFEPTRDFHPRRFSSSTESSPPPSIPSNPVPQSVRQTDISRRCPRPWWSRWWSEFRRADSAQISIARNHRSSGNLAGSIRRGLWRCDEYAARRVGRQVEGSGGLEILFLAVGPFCL